MFRTMSLAALQLVCLASFASAGPFDSYLTNGVAPASIVAWADTVENYSPTSEVNVASSNASRALGPANAATVSLGDLDAVKIAANVAPGSITVSFQNA